MQFLTSKSKSALLGTTVFLFAVFIIVTVVTIDEQKEKSEIKDTAANSESAEDENLQANYFMENYSIISINTNGQPHRWLSGEKLSRFPDNTTVLTQPKIQIKIFSASNLSPSNKAIGESWLLVAKSGTIKHDEKIILDGDVQIQQLNSKTKTLNIQTEHLDILLDKNTASTPSDVVVRNENGKINATGMQIDFKAHQLKLLANVKGHYVFE